MGVLDSLDWKSAFFVGDAVDVLIKLLHIKTPDLVVTAIPGNSITKAIIIWFRKLGYVVEPYIKNVSKVLDNIPKSLVLFVDKLQAVIVIS